jgi:hypothetical protein
VFTLLLVSSVTVAALLLARKHGRFTISTAPPRIVQAGRQGELLTNVQGD